MQDEHQSRMLLTRATAGDERALATLLEEHLPRVRAFVRLRMNQAFRRRESTSDVVQSVCHNLLAQQENFEYQGEPQFRAWLFKAALHKIREKQRFHGRQRRDVMRELPQPETVSADQMLQRAYATMTTPSKNMMAEEHVEQLEGAFDQLPEHYREVVTLARLVGLPHDEIAERTGRSVGAVRQILGRALVKLGELLAER